MKIWMTNEEGLVINKETGECYTQAELHDLISTQQFSNFQELQDLLVQLNQVPKFEIRVISGVKRKCMVPKKGYDFNKIFRVEMRKLSKSNLSLNAHGAINKLTPFIVYPMNMLVIDYKQPSMEEIRKLIGVGKNKFNDIMRELEESDIIRKEKIGREVTIYFNPFLINAGLVHEDVIKMFEDSEFNPYDNINYTDIASK